MKRPNNTALTSFPKKDWLKSHHKDSVKKAGYRYTPELNIELPISDIFYGISRTHEFYTSIREYQGKLQRALNGVGTGSNDSTPIKAARDFFNRVGEVIQLLQSIEPHNMNKIPWESINRKSHQAIKLSWIFLDHIREETEKLKKQNNGSNNKTSIRPSDRLGFDTHYTYEVQDNLNYIIKYSSSSSAALSNKPYLFLTGLAGNGKTHLLCDLIKRLLANDMSPAFAMLFGEHFTDTTDFWAQASIQLGLGAEYKKHKVLQELNKVGKKSGSRSLLIIDALNESRPMTAWNKWLTSIRRELKKYPHVALVVSVRSGFEDEVATTHTRKLFVLEEHRGFQFKEWEAVSKFFNEFSLPLPEIPLLLPEFQNPLFLLLFCKAFERRKVVNAKNNHEKQIFRGHEGATYIFENFVKNIADKLATDFSLPTGRLRSGEYIIWDTVIEKVAEAMVANNTDRICEDKLKEIIINAHPDIDAQKFSAALDKSLLLVQTPRYNRDFKGVDGFDYRFPFQKFSDHLLGRYIFKQYEREFGKQNKNLKTAKIFFSKRRRLGKFLASSWNRGIIEALSIQCPEQLRGIEFFQVAPYIDDRTQVESFLESLVWRSPKAFDKENTATNYINHKIIKNEDWLHSLLNTFLTTAVIPSHPFNANSLHNYLFKHSMPERDSWWLDFLHNQYGEHGAVDRLIEWGWSHHTKSHVSDESTKLCATSLAWLLASSNRFLRDKATKALVSILTDRLNIIIDLLLKFKDVDDLYILDRLYAVGYGCALRSRNDINNLKKLAKFVYKTNFEEKNLPRHILIRDYARGIIEVAAAQNLISPNKAILQPPYWCKWPKNVPTEKSLSAKYYPDDFFKKKTEDRGYLDIWNSVMYASTNFPGDFGKNKIDPALSHWSGRRLGKNIPHRDKLFDEFKADLNPKQLQLLDSGNPFHGLSAETLRRLFKKAVKSVSLVETISDNDVKLFEKQKAQDKKQALQRLKKSLPIEKRKLFEKEIEPYLDERGMIHDPLSQFDTSIAQRWIFSRVVELGWSPNLHGQFDRYMAMSRHDRSEHKAERIGKKYQWIALHELLAMVADNFEFIGDRTSDEAFTYDGAWQISGIRDIDPSCILHEPPNAAPDNLPIFNKPKQNYSDWLQSAPYFEWLKTARKLPNPTPMMELVDSTGVSWIALSGNYDWDEGTPPELERYQMPTRRLYYRITSYLVKDKDANAVISWAKKQNYFGRWMPESGDFYNIFLGEYPSYPAFLHQYIPYYNHDEWTYYGRKAKIPTKLLVTDDTYLSSGSSIDCSVEQAIRVKLPAKWLVDRMEWTQNHVDGRFYDRKGELVAYDPTVFSDKNAPDFLLIRKDKLQSLLKKTKCSIFWTLLGEKNTIGGGGIGQPYGWQEISGVYFFDTHMRLTGSRKSKFHPPS